MVNHVEEISGSYWVRCTLHNAQACRRRHHHHNIGENEGQLSLDKHIIKYAWLILVPASDEESCRLLIKMDFSVDFDFRMEGSGKISKRKSLDSTIVCLDVRNAVLLNVFNSFNFELRIMLNCSDCSPPIRKVIHAIFTASSYVRTASSIEFEIQWKLILNRYSQIKLIK